MTDLPDPLTPENCDIRDHFPYMPLYVQRLRDSGFAIHVDPASGFYAMFAWAAAWHQVPAASLPDDEAELARLLSFGRNVEEFRKVRDGALYGFIKCSDSRLYHPVIAEAAMNAWEKKEAMRSRKERDSARAKKAAEKRWGMHQGERANAQAMLGESASNASSMHGAMLKKKGIQKKENGSIDTKDDASQTEPPECEEIRERLARMVEEKSYDQWIDPMHFAVSESNLIVTAGTSFVRDYVHNNFERVLNIAAHAVLGEKAEVIFRCEAKKKRH